MVRNRTARALFLSGIVALAVIIAAFFAITSPTHAAPASVGQKAPPFQSNITQKVGGLPHFAPKTLSCTRVQGQTCITIKNTTSSSQAVLLNGVVVYTIKHGQSQPITYTNAGTYVYSLQSNSAATLTVTVS